MCSFMRTSVRMRSHVRFYDGMFVSNARVIPGTRRNAHQIRPKHD